MVIKNSIYTLFLSIILALLTAACENENDSSKHPTTGFKEIEVPYEELIDEESPKLYYTYTTFCNASNYPLVVFYYYLGGAGNLLQPGEMGTYMIVHESFWGVEGHVVHMSEFDQMEVYWKVSDKEEFPYRVREIHEDFGITSPVKSLGDERYWHYEVFSSHRGRWVYVFTDEDFLRAKRLTEEREANQ